jgi:hypothetical protein
MTPEVIITDEFGVFPAGWDAILTWKLTKNVLRIPSAFLNARDPLLHHELYHSRGSRFDNWLRKWAYKLSAKARYNEEVEAYGYQLYKQILNEDISEDYTRYAAAGMAVALTKPAYRLESLDLDTADVTQDILLMAQAFVELAARYREDGMTLGYVHDIPTFYKLDF